MSLCIDKKEMDKAWDDIYSLVNRCPECRGSGRDEHGDDCKRCKRKGKTTEEFFVFQTREDKKKSDTFYKYINDIAYHQVAY